MRRSRVRVMVMVMVMPPLQQLLVRARPVARRHRMNWRRKRPRSWWRSWRSRERQLAMRRLRRRWCRWPRGPSGHWATVTLKLPSTPMSFRTTWNTRSLRARNWDVRNSSSKTWLSSFFSLRFQALWARSTFSSDYIIQSLFMFNISMAIISS